jgi:hypothetical protein
VTNPGESPVTTRANFPATERILREIEWCFHAWKPDIYSPMEFTMFVELDAREADGLTISLEWDRDTESTQVVVRDLRAGSHIAFPVPQARAGDAFRHPFTYAP